MQEYTQSSSVLDFLGRFNAMLDGCERLAAKPFNTEINVTVDDIEIEARGSTTLGQRYLALRKLLETKDMMIEHLVEERDSLQQELQVLDYPVAWEASKTLKLLLVPTSGNEHPYVGGACCM